MTNPVGFANVRAHAEAHLRAMSQAVIAQAQGLAQSAPPTSTKGKS